LRELEDRDLTYKAPVAQIKSEILSQGFPSLQISRPSVASPSRLDQPFHRLLIPQPTMSYSCLGVSNTDPIQTGIFSGQSTLMLANSARNATFVKRLSLAGRVFFVLRGISEAAWRPLLQGLQPCRSRHVGGVV